MNLAMLRSILLTTLCLLGLAGALPAQQPGSGPRFLHPMIPIPMPRKAPRYASHFQWLPLNRGNYPDLMLLEGSLEAGAFAKVRFGRMLFEGTVEHYRDLVEGYPVRTDGVIPCKGRLTFENGDVYTGQLTRFRRYPYVFVEGDYAVKAEATRIHFYPVDFPMDGRTYTFDNGDTLDVGRRYEEQGLFFEAATYRYASGATLRMNHMNGDTYDGIFDYVGPDGLTIRGRVQPHSLTPALLWDFKDPKLGAYRLLFIVFPMGDRIDVFGVAPDRAGPGAPRWLLHDGGKAPVPVRRLTENVYGLSGNCQDEVSEFLVIGDPWIYRAKAPFLEGKPAGQIRATAFHAFQTSSKFTVTGFMEGFAFDGACERSRDGSKEPPITLLAEKGVFRKGYLKGSDGGVIELNQPDHLAIYSSWNQKDVKRTYASGIVYIGTTDDVFRPSGEGTVYFPDQSYLVSDQWKAGEVAGKGRFYANASAKEFVWMDFSFFWPVPKVRKPVVVFSPPPQAAAAPRRVVRGPHPCTRCEGTGSVFINCTSCYGKGYKRDITSYNRLTGRVEGTGMVTCATCKGGGRIRIMGCVTCDGTGKAAQ